MLLLEACLNKKQMNSFTTQNNNLNDVHYCICCQMVKWHFLLDMRVYIATRELSTLKLTFYTNHVVKVNPMINNTHGIIPSKYYYQ